MEIRLTFVYGGVEVVVVSETTAGLTDILKEVARSVEDAFGIKGVPKPALVGVPGISPAIPSGSLQDRIQILADEVGTEIGTLRQVVHFGEEYPVLLRPIDEPTRTKQQRKAALVLGTILDLVYQKAEVGSSVYSEVLRKSNVDERRFDRAMIDLKGLFIPKGEARGRSYEITVPGRKEGLSILREMASAQGQSVT